MTMVVKRVAVIGAGASGLTSIKSLLDEGLEPVCFERTGDVGGLWYFTPEIREGQACVMKSTVINTAKEMMCYSDFPIPQDFPNFMHNTKVLEYFRRYSKHFNLDKHIHFNTEIQEIKRTADFNTTGQWQLTIKDIKNSSTSVQIFDAVMVCSGHHADKNMPKFEGLSDFTGKIVHPHDYKDHQDYVDKRAVIIGIGNSAGDVAVELSRTCRQVYLSTRRGSWVINRISDHGYPVDMLFMRRSVEAVRSLVPHSIVNYIAEAKLNSRFDHEKYGLKPAHSVYEQHPMVNDELPNRIACGSVIIKPDVKRFTKTGVEFVDGTSVDNIDVIITATGYIFAFPYLEEGLIKVENNVVDLYKQVFIPNASQHTLAVIGCFQPVGAINPIAEMQARWAARVFKGSVTLPSEAEMWSDIYEKREAMAKRYVKSMRHTIQVDYIPFMDELAELVGCKPDIGKLLLSDPKLACEVMFGPCTPYQFRLMGPNVWPGARHAIMTQWDRTLYPLQSALTSKEQCQQPIPKFIILVLLLAIFLRYVLGVL